MEAYIDEKGKLFIKRNNNFVKQACPYAEQICGDGCPLFFETIHEIVAYNSVKYKELSVSLYCSGNIVTYEIEKDLREGGISRA